MTNPVCINLGSREYPDWRIGTIIRPHDLNRFVLARLDDGSEVQVHEHQIKPIQKKGVDGDAGN